MSDHAPFLSEPVQTLSNPLLAKNIEGESQTLGLTPCWRKKRRFIPDAIGLPRSPMRFINR